MVRFALYVVVCDQLASPSDRSSTSGNDLLYLRWFSRDWRIFFHPLCKIHRTTVIPREENEFASRFDECLNSFNYTQYRNRDCFFSTGQLRTMISGMEKLHNFFDRWRCDAAFVICRWNVMMLLSLSLSFFFRITYQFNSCPSFTYYLTNFYNCSTAK